MFRWIIILKRIPLLFGGRKSFHLEVPFFSLSLSLSLNLTIVLSSFCAQYVADMVQSTLVAEKDAPCNHHKKREEEFPKQNGQHCNNGVRADFRSDRLEERQPDVVDDYPSKSRFTF